MGKTADSPHELTKRLDALIALGAIQSKEPQDKIIRLLAKQGLSYKNIESITGASSATIAKVLKKK